MSPLALLLLAACAGPAGEDDTSADPVPPDTPLDFLFPVEGPDLVSTTVVGMDHDPEDYDGVWQLTCTNYAGEPFPWCYDGHDGSDFLLVDGFTTMDAGSATVLAAAPGTVTETEDGHYDRCHGDLSTLEATCDGNDMVANSVIVEHDTGHRTLYWHLMNGSVLVAPGDRVDAGDPLGKVGSSGNSTAPHLHFELQDADGGAIDPYAGAYSQPESWWCSQGEDLDDLPGGCGG